MRQLQPLSQKRAKRPGDIEPKPKLRVYAMRVKAIAPAEPQLPILQSTKPESVGDPSIWAEIMRGFSVLPLLSG
ncbi:Protein of unknown function [Pyronema omphalodes CBS 100304]|uniref:Uncharacterized protein n=1 Tax=Pyronema omphalodes (strain CBS 100304) TaxID=1076935 RepID=U4LSU4_PYROM|nr:Protein of unknown function [Pyronema omphalodes CBS 100304]